MTVPQIQWVGSPNYGYPRGIHGRHGHAVKAIVHHIMAGTLAGTDSWFQNPKSNASTHFGIGENGEIHQYVALTDAAWGNGWMNKPDLSIPWLKECWEQNFTPNLVTVSIEYEGRHQTNEAGHITNPNWAPTEAQYQAGLTLTRWLCDTLGITPSNDTIIGHYRIDAVDRPYCPGPKFPFARMLADLKAPAWTLPVVRVVKLDGTEMWGVLESGKTIVQKNGREVWIREEADFLGARTRYAPNPPTVFLEAPAQPPADTGKYQRR